MNKTTQQKAELSLVFPIFNEEKIIPLLNKEINKFVKKLPSKTELIFVNDGSTDKTHDQLKKIKTKYPFKIINFSRNFGHQAALLAGLQESSGEYVVTLDADLQHPLNIIPEMLKLHKQGYDVVLTQRIDEKTINKSKQFFTKLFYKFINILSDTKVLENGSDFRSLNRKALTALLSLPEQRKFLRGMIQWIGYKTIIIPFQAKKRVEGVSKYSLSKMTNLALHGLTSSSTKPLYLSGIFSIILFILALIYAIYVLYVRFWGTGIVDGWASVLFVVLIIGGFLSLFLGLIGAYIAAIYDETKNRPGFFVSSTWNSK
ncbi:MAG: glycosyltransferase family 2 protein [Candidatus Pacebacteria bacterium]|jgi:glycosyltransferase involved in cell wall biosynthesis|nr:glycosyltransferase family 2 protein [Candidatus Paceibacterota bacterium]MBT6756049.1 glycosyltransferase family 2 protein [Candidatus Paceibacterota bacterium]